MNIRYRRLRQPLPCCQAPTTFQCFTFQSKVSRDRSDETELHRGAGAGFIRQYSCTMMRGICTTTKREMMSGVANVLAANRSFIFADKDSVSLGLACLICKSSPAQSPFSSLAGASHTTISSRLHKAPRYTCFCSYPSWPYLFCKSTLF